MKTVLFAFNFASTTVIIAIDIIILFVALKIGQVRKQLVLWTIFLSMAMDVSVYLITITHDVPSFALDTDIFKAPELTYISIVLLCCQWFGQLFVLLVLAVLHFIAVFFPTNFRTLSPTHMHMINIGIVIIGLLFAVPMFTPYCGYSYSTHGHYWNFDMSKPYTYIYWTVNLVLQGICVAVVACVDTIIIWKICMLRTHPTMKMTNNTVTASGFARKATVIISRELRLAINFLFLSGCFLLMTIFFNVPYQQGFWYEFLMKFTSNINLSKWAIYALGNTLIRQGIHRLFKCRQIDSSASTSFVSKAPT